TGLSLLHGVMNAPSSCSTTSTTSLRILAFCSIAQTFSQPEKDRGNAPLEASFLGASVLVL
ncbi:MAG: hypothetical protein SOX10_03145, partial [Duodenibacillus sp.]|nr:hypothetical protein [Duodenibacillus sp.]